MSVDKNLFPYDLAIVAIFKDEARYLKEWLDYHLLAGVEHFYLYNNDSSDNYAEVLAPYVETNLVTLINFPGKMMQIPAYDDALRRFRFFCRYMAFIDLDEFIFPRTGQSIVEIADEIFSHDDKAAGLAINWQIFGSNNLQTADYSRGVLERFTRRAPRDWLPAENVSKEYSYGNTLVKSIVDPRKVDFIPNPHCAIYFGNFRAVNENGKVVEEFINAPVTVDKIAVHHYYLKSHEESSAKLVRGRADVFVDYSRIVFDIYNRNDEFDDSILTYRAARVDNFSIESDEHRFQRVEKILLDTLTQRSPLEAPPEFFVGKLETFLTCRALAELLGTKIGSHSAEEFALVWIYKTFDQGAILNYYEIRLFMNVLPKILARPFPMCRKILQMTLERVIPTFLEFLKVKFNYGAFTEIQYIQQLLNLI